MASVNARDDTGANQIQFIDLTDQSPWASKQNRHLVRSHIAKKNRRKRTQLSAQGQQGAEPHPRTNVLLRPSLDRRYKDDSIVDSIDHSSSIDRENFSTSSSPLCDLAPPPASCGAVSAISPDVGDYTSFSDSASYMLHVIMPNAFLPPPAWIEIFSREPLVYHAFSFSMNLQLLFSNNNAPATPRRRMLFHKGEAIRLLNERISNLKTEDIEIVLVGMLTSYPDEDAVAKASVLEPNLFVPHMPWSNNNTTYAGPDPQGLYRAVTWLVERAGGLLNLKLRALPKAMGKYGALMYLTNHISYADHFQIRVDLLLASSSYSKPAFPWLWKIDASVLTQHSGYLITTDSATGTAIGFSELAEYLPAAAISCFRDLAIVDQVLAHTRTHRLQDVDLDILITARDTAHHRLITLPPWNDIIEPERQNVDHFVYECCRLASILYVHSVTSPLLQGCPGIVQPLAELQALLELNHSRFDEVKISGMILWSMFIGGLAAFRSRHRNFFIQTLRELMIAHHVASLQHARNISRKFIWADCALLQGTSVIWDFMGFGAGVAAQP